MRFNKWDDEVKKMVEDRIGQVKVIEEHRRGSMRTGVWRVQAKSCSYFIKAHSRRGHFNTEVYAYRHWMPCIAPYAPQLCHVFDNNSDLFGIIITDLNGTTLKTMSCSNEKLQEAFRLAGHLVRTLHNTFQHRQFGTVNSQQLTNKDTTNAIMYIANQLQSIFKEGLELKLYNKDIWQQFDWAISHLSVLEGENAVPVNWDSSPNNWIANSQGDFKGFIDFENMLWGIDTDSFGILYERYFKDDIELRRAYFNGYGRDIIDEKFTALKIMLIKLGLADVLWGAKHNDQRVKHLGEQLLINLKKDSFIYKF